MEESKMATIFLKALSHLMDEVFTRVAKLQDALNVFAADINFFLVTLFTVRSFIRSTVRSFIC